MFFPNYTNNETYTGPLSVDNELTIDVNDFPKYANHVKSVASNGGTGKKNKRTNGSSGSTSTGLSIHELAERSSNGQQQALPPYTMNEFLVTNTRMKYIDGVRSLGFAAPPYTSPIGLQNIVRLVIGPDIGYYLPDEHHQRRGEPTNRKNPSRSNEQTNDEDEQSSDTEVSDEKEIESNVAGVEHFGYVHSDYTRKYSPQEAHSRVLAMPLYNGNTTTTILQSNKSERYYQLTMLLESSSRIYVLPAATIPCYTVIMPWAHLCRLLQMNPRRPPERYAVPIERVPEWQHLAKLYGVRYAVLMPSNVSLMNRRDPVIKEGSLQTKRLIFAYDNKDADVQYNNPYGCYNKHEDYDGDTNTQSLGKGVESHVEMYYNMKRQCLPCLRVKSVVPQNMLARIMLYFLRDIEPSFDVKGTADALARIVPRESTRNLFVHNYRTYDRMVRTQHDEPVDYTKANKRVPVAVVQRVFAVELLRRACVCLAHATGHNDPNRLRYTLLPLAERIFGNRLSALLYIAFLREQWSKLNVRVQQFLHNYMEQRSTYESHDDSSMYNAVRDILHEVRGLWKPVSHSLVSNCQTMIDDVTRSLYCLTNEETCTQMLDHCSRVVHDDHPVFFLSGRTYDVEYLANVLARAKGDFDSLLTMHVSLYERFRDEAYGRRLERSRTVRLPLGSRDILSRIEPERIQKYVDYTDKYVIGSKTVPKSCVQANNMKCAMQNVQYYDGDLWMNGELILANVASYLPKFFFVNRQLVDLVLDDLVDRSNDWSTY